MKCTLGSGPVVKDYPICGGSAIVRCTVARIKDTHGIEGLSWVSISSYDLGVKHSI